MKITCNSVYIMLKVAESSLLITSFTTKMHVLSAFCSRAQSLKLCPWLYVAESLTKGMMGIWTHDQKASILDIIWGYQERYEEDSFLKCINNFSVSSREDVSLKFYPWLHQIKRLVTELTKSISNTIWVKDMAHPLLFLAQSDVGYK